jgi:hypothetical protein
MGKKMPALHDGGQKQFLGGDEAGLKTYYYPPALPRDDRRVA